MELTPNIDIVSDAQGTSVAATLSVEERDITRVVLEIVKVLKTMAEATAEFGILSSRRYTLTVSEATGSTLDSRDDALVFRSPSW